MQQIEKRKVTKSAGVKMAPDTPQDDNPVTADVKAATGFVKNLPQKIKQGTQKQEGDAKGESKGLPINLKSKPLKILLIVFGAIVALMVVGKIYQAITGGRSDRQDNVPVVEEGTPTPTARYEISITPRQSESVYANDPLILAVEEELDILRNEISTTPLRESLLIPPTLDFNISF